MSSTWHQILASEQAFFKDIGDRLTEVYNVGADNEPIMQIYAGLHAAYEKGLEELQCFERDLQQIEAIEWGAQLDQETYDLIKEFPADRQMAMIHVLGCERCLERPSDTFRKELRRQQDAIIEMLKNLAIDTDYDGQEGGLTEDIKILGGILTTFGLHGDTPQKTVQMKVVGIAKVAGVAAFGGLLGWLLSRRKDKSSGPIWDLFKKRKPPKQIAASVEDDEDDEEDIDEEIEDVEEVEEVEEVEAEAPVASLTKESDDVSEEEIPLMSSEDEKQPEAMAA